MVVKVLTFLFLVALFASSQAQLTTSDTNTGSFSGTGSGSGSGSGSGTNTGSNSGSGTGTHSGSGTGSATASASATNSATASSSGSSSGSGTVTHPLPCAPTLLINTCLRQDGTPHQFYICAGWTDACGLGRTFEVTVTPAGGVAQTFTTTVNAIVVFPLTPGTAYAFSIVSLDSAGRRSLPLTGSFTTSPTDARTDPTKDLQNVGCKNNTLNPITGRTTIVCNWTLPAVGPSRIEVDARCVSTLQRNRRIHKVLPGTGTSVVLNIGRTNTRCKVNIAGFYTNHVNTQGRGHNFRYIVLITSKPAF